MGWDWVHLVCWRLMIREYGALGGTWISRENWSTWRKHASVSGCYPKYHMTWPGIESGSPLWGAIAHESTVKTDAKTDSNSWFSGDAYKYTILGAYRARQNNSLYLSFGFPIITATTIYAKPNHFKVVSKFSSTRLHILLSLNTIC
jgi:hypothetical protein